MNDSKILVNVKRLSANAHLPQYQSQSAAGADLYAALDKPMTINPLSRALIPTGIAIEITESGYAAFVFARSGLASKYGICLSNGVGVIDSDYRGEIKVAMINISNEPYTISPGERIAQLALMPALQARFFECDHLSETERMGGGFGSTGKE